MTAQQALAFVKRHGIVLQAARGPAPSLAAEIAGGPIRGSWWAHPRAQEIFHTTRAVSTHPDVLVCKVAGGKITYVHRRLWPALVKLATRFPRERLARVREEHTATGAHASRSIPFPDWVPADIRTEAVRLSIQEAERTLGLSNDN
jgi:hypothetical protein